MTIGQKTTLTRRPSRRGWAGLAGLAAAVILSPLALAPTPAGAVPACGTSATVGADVVVTFTSSCSWTVPAGVTSVDALVIGGGGGAATDGGESAGGGAGGLIYRTGSGNTGFAVSGSSVPVTVGSGGVGDPTCNDAGSGTSSAFGTLVATGGGGGAGACGGSGNGLAGGSGGGAADCYDFDRLGGPADTSGGQQAHAGGNAGGPGYSYCTGNGGGGGGAGTAGALYGIPGAGVSVSITGSAVTYAAGGSAISGFNYATQTPAATYPSIGGGGRAIAPSDSADSGAAGKVIVRYTALAAPGTPGTPSAVAGDAAATVTVSAPGSGGAPAYYTVSAVEAPARTCTITVPATTCTITGLTNGTGYTFTATATNAGGTSASSAASLSAVVPFIAAPGVPGQPATSADDGQVTITVAAPASGGPVASYTVRVVGDATRFCVVTVPPLSCSVTGLTNGNDYRFEVSATNATGTSAWSAPSRIVTPFAPVGAPAAPSSVTAVAGAASLTVSWPAVPGAQSYLATARPGPATCTVTGTSCVLGATAGTTYTVTVVALAAGRTSPASAPSNPVTPAAPAVPPSPPTGAPVTLTTDQGPIGVASSGATITVIGSGFAPFSTADVIIYSTPTRLGSAVTDATGSFSLPVTVPAGLPAGAHTFLASGVDPSGQSRLMALPVTVAADSGTDGTLPVPSGGTITLLDAAGLAVSTVTVPEGRYVLDPTTGVIGFVPVDGFTGTATAVRYRITDALGTVVTGTHTAVVGPADPAITGQALLFLPHRIIAGTGAQATAGVPCWISTGVIDECGVTATAQVKGQTVIVGRGSIRPLAVQQLQHVTVPLRLTATGRALTARPGGVRMAFAAVLSQRDHTGTASIRDATTVLARTFALPRVIGFGTGSAKVGPADARYLNTVRSQLSGATAITCTGHADRRDGPAPGALAARRATAACAILARQLGIAVHIVSHRDQAPSGNQDTPAARARDRRVEISVVNQ
jgi:CshA-type fibril repeat protein